MTNEMMQAALRDALAEARHGDREPLRKTVEWMMAEPMTCETCEGTGWVTMGVRGSLPCRVCGGDGATTEPWLQEWFVDPAFDVEAIAFPAGGLRVRCADTPRGRLAAAAPALARALLVGEWNGRTGEVANFKCCPGCGAFRGHGHDAACPVDAALRQAGLATAEERNEARAALEKAGVTR